MNKYNQGKNNDLINFMNEHENGKITRLNDIRQMCVFERKRKKEISIDFIKRRFCLIFKFQFELFFVVPTHLLA